MSVWDYQGKRVVITGCFSGMGEAAARELVRLGAEVHGFDIKESPVDMASFHKVDLADKSAIEAAVRTVEGAIDAVFYCAGRPQTFTPMEVMRVNFIGLRHFIDLMKPKVRRGGAIALIASTAGFRWSDHLAQIQELIATPDYDSAVAWCEARPELIGDGYGFSKEAATVWTMTMGSRYIRDGVRINCICPGPTQTPMMKDFEQVAGAALIDVFTNPILRRSSPAEQAYPLIFLNSDAASYINGHVLNVDAGFVGGVATGELDLPALLAPVMAAR